MYSRFISSGIASLIENGHPRYLAGLSGVEMAIMATGKEAEADFRVFPGPEYWAGWALAYLQWETCRTFSELSLKGLDIDKVIHMYHPYHEADISKFASDAKKILEQGSRSRLKTIRKASGLTQESLSAKSDVSLRAIRSYEQNSRSLLKAEAETLLKLSGALGCTIHDLI